MTNACTPHALMWITHRPDIVFTEGEGSWLRDREGKRYLDFVQGWASRTVSGIARRRFATRSRRKLRSSSPSAPLFTASPAMQLAQRLAELSALERVFFTSTGAEANEGAIKLARKWGRIHRGGAFEIITFDNSFHGRTLATMAASGKPGWDTLFGAPQVPGFPKKRASTTCNPLSKRSSPTTPSP